jgi:hypothetical protein
MIAPDTFARMWIDARERVLTRYADQARDCARRMREHADRFPDDLDAIQRETADLDRYADACEMAAADPTLPTPEYLPEEPQ